MLERLDDVLVNPSAAVPSRLMGKAEKSRSEKAISCESLNSNGTVIRHIRSRSDAVYSSIRRSNPFRPLANLNDLEGLRQVPDPITVVTKPSPLEDIATHRRFKSVESTDSSRRSFHLTNPLDASWDRNEPPGRLRHRGHLPMGSVHDNEWEMNVLQPENRHSGLLPVDDYERSLQAHRAQGSQGRGLAVDETNSRMPTYDAVFANSQNMMQQDNHPAGLSREWQRIPSYEGTAYGGSSFSSLRGVQEQHSFGPYNNFSNSTRIPSPAQTRPTENTRQYRSVLEHTGTRADAIPGLYATSAAPPIPTRNPMRQDPYNASVAIPPIRQMRNEMPVRQATFRQEATRQAPFRQEQVRQEQVRQEAVRQAPVRQDPVPRIPVRIVSKENIRAALGNISRDTSTESLRRLSRIQEANEQAEQAEQQANQPSRTSLLSDGSIFRYQFAGIGGRGLNTGEYIPAEVAPPGAYNTHMFPRMGVPSHSALARRRQASATKRYEANSLERKRDGAM